MNISRFLRYNYYLNSSITYFKSNFENRVKFIKKKKFLFNEISSFINNCIDSSKSILIFCAGNSIIGQNIKSNKILIKEIVESKDIWGFQNNQKFLFMRITFSNLKKRRTTD